MSLACLLAACTTHNPDYLGGGGGGDLAGVSLDLAGAVLDLAGPMGACSAGQRMCAGTVASDRCEGGMFVVDRVCPASSLCVATYCAPPPAAVIGEVGHRCDGNGGPQQLQCMAMTTNNLSCQPFVNPTNQTVRWFCDASVGPGIAGTHCTRGAECRSGFCGSNGTCFDACQNDQDCKLFAGLNLTCQGVDILVEGVRVQANSCIP